MKRNESATMRRGLATSAGQMPAGMMADLKSGAIGGSEADGMPVGSMNTTSRMSNPGVAGTGPLQEMPPAGSGAFQDMPAGNMGAAPAADPTDAKFEEMPQLGAKPGAASGASAPAAADGAIVLAGEWRLQLTLRGQS
jgi:hypothetical protein